MFSLVSSNHLSSEEIIRCLKNLQKINYSTYDQLIFDTDLKMKPLATQIEKDLKKMSLDIEKMIIGEYKWGEEVIIDTWQYNIKEVAREYINLPEKHMIDLIKLQGFREIVEPIHIRILLESSEEIFENQERMKNLEVVSNIFELWMRLHLMADVSFYPKIDSNHIQLMDPFMRSKVREQNRKNADFKEKYLSEKFNIKKFVLGF